MRLPDRLRHLADTHRRLFQNMDPSDPHSVVLIWDLFANFGLDFRTYLDWLEQQSAHFPTDAVLHHPPTTFTAFPYLIYHHHTPADAERIAQLPELHAWFERFSWTTFFGNSDDTPVLGIGLQLLLLLRETYAPTESADASVLVPRLLASAVRRGWYEPVDFYLTYLEAHPQADRFRAPVIGTLGELLAQPETPVSTLPRRRFFRWLRARVSTYLPETDFDRLVRVFRLLVASESASSPEPNPPAAPDPDADDPLELLRLFTVLLPLREPHHRSPEFKQRAARWIDAIEWTPERAERILSPGPFPTTHHLAALCVHGPVLRRLLENATPGDAGVRLAQRYVHQLPSTHATKTLARTLERRLAKLSPDSTTGEAGAGVRAKVVRGLILEWEREDAGWVPDSFRQYPFPTYGSATRKLEEHLVAELNQIVPFQISSSHAYFYGHYDPARPSDMFETRFEDQAVQIPCTYAHHLNAELERRQLPYRLAFLPVRVVTDNHRSQPTYELRLRLLNRAELDYLNTTYLPERFPDFPTDRFTFAADFPDAPALPVQPPTAPARNHPWRHVPAFRWVRERVVDPRVDAMELYPLLEVFAHASGTKPPAHFTKAWEQLRASLDPETVHRRMTRLLDDTLEPQPHPWFWNTVQPLLRGFFFSVADAPTETGLLTTARLAKLAYRKVPGEGAVSTAMGNAALAALAQSGHPTAYGQLHLLRSQTKYAAFTRAIDRALETFAGNTDLDPGLLADQTLPTHDFTAAGERLLPLDERVSLRLYVEHFKLKKRWQYRGGSHTTAPADLPPARLKTARTETKRINDTLKSLRARLRSYWLDGRTWTRADWETYLTGHPLLRPWLNGLVWRTVGGGRSFLLTATDGCVDVHGRPFEPDATARLELWHPVNAPSEAVRAWRAYAFEHPLEQSVRQIFREQYRFSPTEAALTQSPRFGGHFLKTHQLMALANGAGWTFAYAHEDVSWPHRYFPTADLTVHLECAYDNYSAVLPTKNFYFTRGKTAPDFQRRYAYVPLAEVPSVLRSECCRDVDLFISVASIAHDPELAARSEPMQRYLYGFWTEDFSENGSVEVRAEVVGRVLPALRIHNFRVAGNWLHLTGTLNEYRIHLGSGFAQRTDVHHHLPLLPEVAPLRRSKRLHIPIPDDEVLYVILAKAKLLANDGDVTDAGLRALLRD